MCGFRGEWKNRSQEVEERSTARSKPKNAGSTSGQSGIFFKALSFDCYSSAKLRHRVNGIHMVLT